MPDKRLGINLLEVGVGRFIVDAFLQVDNNAGRLAIFRKRVTVHANPLGAGELRPNVVVVERNGVVAGAGHFALMRKTREVALVGHFLLALVGLERTGVGHNKHIAEVGAAGAAKVRVRKTRQQAIRIMVARAPVPPFKYILRAQLHGAKRHIGPDKYVAVAPSTNQRVDVGREPRGLRLRRASSGQQQATS
jgi:hypothetical protein